MRSFLGLCTYFMCFISNYSDIVLPLSKIVESKHYIWNSSCDLAFQTLKKRLMISPVLKHPDFGASANMLIVQTDASDTGLAGVILQSDSDGFEHPITYASKKLTKTESNYSTIQREALAIIWAVRKFRDYIYGRKFLLRTDHKPLTFIMTSTKPKCSRWALELSDVQFDIEHVICIENTVSDALSPASIEDNEIDLPVLAVTRGTIARREIIE